MAPVFARTFAGRVAPKDTLAMKGRYWGPCERIVAGSEERGDEARFK